MYITKLLQNSLVYCLVDLATTTKPCEMISVPPTSPRREMSPCSCSWDYLLKRNLLRFSNNNNSFRMNYCSYVWHAKKLYFYRYWYMCRQKRVCVCMPMYLCTSKLTYQLQQTKCCSLYELPLDAATQPCKTENSDLRITETCLGISMTVEFLQEH